MILSRLRIVPGVRIVSSFVRWIQQPGPVGHAPLARSPGKAQKITSNAPATVPITRGPSIEDLGDSGVAARLAACTQQVVIDTGATIGLIRYAFSL
jgi:hypothetical protein